MNISERYIKKADAMHLALADTPSVTLTLAQRRRSRQRLELDHTGEPLGMALERGHTLRDGDVLVTRDNTYVRIIAAHEDVVRVTAASPWQLARAAYHLGNRHVLLEINQGYLQFEYVPVLVDMLEQVGNVTTVQVDAPFEPDVGAYGGGHRHGHDESFEEDYALAQQAYHAHEPSSRSLHHHGDSDDQGNDASGQAHIRDAP